VNLFQRLRRPFSDGLESDLAQPAPAVRPVGVILSERREELGLSLDVIGEALRIRPGYLAAIEQGRAQDLPGPTYAIGFIRAYAQYLGLDGDRVLDRYKSQSADVHVRPDLTLPVPLAERSLPGAPILLVALILALCGYGTWYYLSTGERSRPERVAAIPAELQPAAKATDKKSGGQGAPAPPDHVADKAGAAPPVSSTGESGPAVDASTAGEAASPGGEAAAGKPATGGPAASASVASVSPPPASSGAVARSDDAASKPGEDIEIRAVADCWIQVRSGETQSIVFSRVLKAGQTYRVPRAGLFLRTGNAGALAITVDGKAAPTIGRVGTLRRNVALDPEALLAGTAVHD